MTHLKLLQVGIGPLIKLLPYCRKIHWMLDNIMIVRQLAINAHEQANSQVQKSKPTNQTYIESSSLKAQTYLFRINRLWEYTISVLPARNKDTQRWGVLELRLDELKVRKNKAASTATHFCSLSRMKTNNFLFGKGVVGPESEGSVQWTNPTHEHRAIEGTSIS